MADEDDIVQRLRLEGGAEFIATMGELGSAGKKAFSDIRSAVGQVVSAYRAVSKEATSSASAIRAGGEAGAAATRRVAQASQELGKAISSASDTAVNSYNRISDALKNVGSAARAVGNSIRTSFSSLATAGFSKLQGSLGTFGSALKQTGSAVGTFAKRTAVGLAATATAGVYAFRSLASAALGQASAARSAAREQTAAINSQKQDSTQLAGIARQGADAQEALARSYGQGKLSLEDYTTGLQDLEAEQAKSIRSALAGQAAQDAAQKRQLESLAKLREQQAFDQVADKVGGQAAAAFVQLGTTIDQVANKAKQTLGPVLAQIVTGINQAIQQNMPAIQAFIDEIKAAILPLGTDIPTAFREALPGIFEFIRGMVDGIKLIVTAVQGIIAVFNVVATVINSVFGTKFTGAALAGTAAVVAFSGALGIVLPLLKLFAWGIAALVGAIGFIPALIVVVVAAFIGWLAYTGRLTAAWNALKGLWAGIKTAVVSAVNTIVETWNGVIKFFQDLPETIGTLAGKVWNYVTQKASDAVNTIKGYWTSFLATLEGYFNSIKQKALNFWMSLPEGFRNLFSGKGAEVAAAASGGSVAAAGGGHIRGPGTGTSDSIPAWLSDNEFVHRAAAVRKYGVGFMRSINNLTFDPDGLAQKFSMGGPVAPSPVLRFAEGGEVSSNNVLNLTLDGEQFNGLRANDDTMDRLKKRAIKKSLSPRTPNWYR